MVDKIGLSRTWYIHWVDIPHFDVCQSKRQLAIKYGTKPVTTKEMLKMLRE